MEKNYQVTWQRVFNISDNFDLVKAFVKDFSDARGEGTYYKVEFMAHLGHQFHGFSQFLVTEKSYAGGSPFTRNQLEAKYGVKE